MDKGPLYIYNSINRKKEIFKSILPGRIGLYVCGPTVYSDVHLGNVRTFMTFDMVYRYLVYLGYKVRYVRNITDVGHLTGDSDDGEDKIAKKAKLENLEPMEVVHTTIDYSMKEVPDQSPLFTSYEESFYSSFVSTETQPPDFMS